MQIEENVSLAPFTTFHIGGLARFFVRVKSTEELKEALQFARDEKLKTLVLGGGSNVLISDAGFDGLVIKVEIQGVEVQTEEKEVKNTIKEAKPILIAGAGESWDDVVSRAVGENLWGIENLSGIPGTVGGATAGNIGAYGQALSQTLLWAEVLDSETGEVAKMTNSECQFGYRESFFSKQNAIYADESYKSPRYSILRAAFALSSEPRPEISYKDLAARFTSSPVEKFVGEAPTLVAIREAILTIRKGKFPDLEVEGTAGSFFKNPILTKQEAEVLKEKYPNMPLFIMPETSGVKVPLGWFLDYRHGVIDARTLKIGGARMFEKQFLVVVAARGTTAADVQTLIQKVQTSVKEKTGMNIEPEVKIIH